MDNLKLLALDSEDLEVISAHMQDAVLRVGDMSYLPAENRFVLVSNRFNWMKAHKTAHNDKSNLERRQTALRFERVMGAQVQNLKLTAKDAALELLAITYEQQNDVESVILTFAGGGAVRLHVECIEAELKDLGGAWETKAMPQHDNDEEKVEI